MSRKLLTAVIMIGAIALLVRVADLYSRPLANGLD